MRPAWLWFLPLALTSADALAWGLDTHVYFAQLLLWAVPLADRRFARAAQAFPRLVLAGACLPDLSLVSGPARAPGLAATHGWPNAARLIAAAQSDAERALALGYAGHLLADVIAHNHFVPAHEHVWFDTPLLAHAVAEWTMDAYLRRHLFATPGQLLAGEAPRAGPFVDRSLGCRPGEAARAMGWLARGEGLLRGSRLPQALHAVARRADAQLQRRLDHYLRRTAERLRQIDRLLAGEQPWWAAEVSAPLARARLAGCSPRVMLGRLALPQDFFQAPSTLAASAAPMAAPASTSPG